MTNKKTAARKLREQFAAQPDALNMEAMLVHDAARTGRGDERLIGELAREMREADGATEQAPLSQYLVVARRLIDAGWTKA